MNPIREGIDDRNRYLSNKRVSGNESISMDRQKITSSFLGILANL